MKLTPGINHIDINGQNDLVLTYNHSALTLDLSQESNVQATVQHLHFVTLTGRTRIGRFFHAMKYVWKYCK